MTNKNTEHLDSDSEEHKKKLSFNIESHDKPIVSCSPACDWCGGCFIDQEQDADEKIKNEA